ncbi:hypothetical protein GCM10027422_23110 [Hymenobacter arcticus]
MAFLNLSSLSTTAFESAYRLNEDVRLFSQPGASKYHVFISYRHEDRSYVPGVAKFLKGLQAGIYVDFLDEELAKAPNSETAPILRRRITQCSKLIQILTPNSSDSRWMPWELGLGDGILGYPNAVTLPVINDYQPRVSQDYLDMYGYIETSKSSNGAFTDWAVIYPKGGNKWFKDWLIS